MALDQQGLFDENCRKRYLAMLTVVEQKRDKLFRNLALLDVAVVILVSGQSVKVPGTEITTANLPVILESVTAAASLSFLFAAAFFVNWTCYGLVIDQFSNRRAVPHHIDPDFVSASEKQFEFYMKLFRKKFNIWGIDFFDPGKSYVTVFGALNAILILGTLLIPLTHIFLITYSSYLTIMNYGVNILTVLYFIVLLLLNIGSLALLLITNVSFAFYVPEEEQPTTSQQDDSPKTGSESVSGTENSL